MWRLLLLIEVAVLAGANPQYAAMAATIAPLHAKLPDPVPKFRVAASGVGYWIGRSGGHEFESSPVCQSFQ